MNNLNSFARDTLRDRYQQKGETVEDLIARVASTFSTDLTHEAQMREYIEQGWFMPSTPILANGGTSQGLPISCYLNRVPDTMKGIAGVWKENAVISSNGGGIGTSWSEVRGVGSKIASKGVSGGIMPFLHVSDANHLAISQGSLRRGSGAFYLNISHPDILEFIDMRKPTGDFNRKCLHSHHGVVISDSFMKAVEADGEWELEDRKKLNARNLFIKILDTRLLLGEPYLLFIDNVNSALPEAHKSLGLKITQSNLCSEITLPTGLDYDGDIRTAVCCLGSINLEHWDEIHKDAKVFNKFICNIMRFLDNVLNDFLKQTKGVNSMRFARESVKKERSIGLGTMGLFSYFQKKRLTSYKAMQTCNTDIYSYLSKVVSRQNVVLGRELGACPDSARVNRPERFSYTMAIAPTASISIIGNCSPSIEPYCSNIFTHKTLTGNYEVKNPYLKKLLQIFNKDTTEVWDSIIEQNGSVSHLEFLSEENKFLFQTAFEFSNKELLLLASSRAKFIDQAQSVNLFISPTTSKKEILSLHMNAWKSGLKSLYYLRSQSLQRPTFIKLKEAEECEVCQ